MQYSAEQGFIGGKMAVEKLFAEIKSD